MQAPKHYAPALESPRKEIIYWGKQMKHKITLERTIVSVIEVEADSFKDAKKQLINYGLLEAWSDYPHEDQSDFVTIIRPKRNGVV